MEALRREGNQAGGSELAVGVELSRRDRRSPLWAGVQWESGDRWVGAVITETPVVDGCQVRGSHRSLV